MTRPVAESGRRTLGEIAERLPNVELPTFGTLNLLNSRDFQHECRTCRTFVLPSRAREKNLGAPLIFLCVAIDPAKGSATFGATPFLCATFRCNSFCRRELETTPHSCDDVANVRHKVGQRSAGGHR